jgi:hypothetical protein
MSTAEDARKRYVPAATRRAVRQAWEAAGRVCEMCGDAVEDEPTDIDHIIPLWQILSGYGRQLHWPSDPHAASNLRVIHRRCHVHHTAPEVAA